MNAREHEFVTSRRSRDQTSRHFRLVMFSQELYFGWFTRGGRGLPPARARSLDLVRSGGFGRLQTQNFVPWVASQ